MKTVKEVSEITGISIRTLRYYDEIGLLKPTQLTDAGYRLYDDKALEKLQEIMFFRELEVPLETIKKIMETPDYDKKQALLTQKTLLESKRNRLNGIIELIDDVLEGVNTMSFEAFNKEDMEKIFYHALNVMQQEDKNLFMKEYGSVEAWRTAFCENLDEKNSALLLKWYGGKEKAMEAALQANGDQKDFERPQDEISKIYQQFTTAMKTENPDMANEAVEKLAENYKVLFKLDNARNILLDLAKEYLHNPQLAEATDFQFGKGCAEYTAYTIQHYYGIEK